MPQTLLGRTTEQIAKTALPSFLACIVTMVLILPAWGGDKEKDEETIQNATTVLQEMLKSNNVPPDLLAKAYCVIVLPNTKKFGVGIGGSGGRGAMSCRAGKNFRGTWSAPAIYSVGGVSAGLQVGGSSSDFVLLIMTEKGVNAILKGKTKLGSDATAAAGPSGATASSVAGSDILTYARAKGLFAGVSLGSATLDPDDDANKSLYGKSISAQEIVRGNAFSTAVGGQPFMFDLVLSSTPQGAATALRRRGSGFENTGQQTDCTIKALPYAIWIIHFEKQGYKPEEREHDPFREPNHVVNVVLKKQ